MIMEFCAKRFDELTLTELYEILRLRAEVFLLEQGIVCQDMDRKDYDSLHCMVKSDGEIVGYLRAFLSDDKSDAVIGRVVTSQHRNGIGRYLTSESIESVKKHFGVSGIIVYAQIQAEGFYEKMGFVRVSDEYIKEGIPHVTMELNM